MFKKTNEPMVIQNKNFKTCILFISYPIEEVDEAKLKMLRNMPFNKSAKYNTEKKMYEVKVNNFCLSYYERIVQLGKTPFLELAVYFPSKNSLGKDVLEDNLKLIKEIIYNPYLENNAFPSKEINDIKEMIKNNINTRQKDAVWYYCYKNEKTIDEDGILSSLTEDNPNLLDEVTPESLYKTYKQIIEDTSPITFLIGNVDEQASSKKIKEILLDNKEEEITFEKKYNYYCKDIANTPKEIIEKTSFKSTGVFYNYKIKNLTSEKDIALLRIVQNLLYSNSSRFLFDNLRKENDLIYRCNVPINPEFGSLTMYAITGKENIDKVKEVYDDVINKISDYNFIKEKLPLIVEEYKLDDDLTKEKISDILMQKVNKYIGFRNQTPYEQFKDITPEEVQNFIKNRLVLVSKYIGVGEDDE